MRHILISLLLGSVPGGGGGEAFFPALFPLLTFNTKGPFIFYQVGGRIADGIWGGGPWGGEVTKKNPSNFATRMPKTSVSDIQKVKIFPEKHASDPLVYSAPKGNSTPLKSSKA